VESAAASGLSLVGGGSGNDPLAATSRGTGELIAEALAAGAVRLLVGVGGSASTDGGLGALEVLEDRGGLGRAEVLVACDVAIHFVDAAREFAPQKGASQVQVAELRERLLALTDRYRDRFGVEVGPIPGAGAAGGLAGGLAVLGAKLVSGIDLVASRVGLDDRIAAAQLVVTGEGRLDSSSWSGKAVGGVVRRALEAKVPVLVVAGSLGPGALPVPGDTGRPGMGSGSSGAPELAAGGLVEVVSLAERFGSYRAVAEPVSCIEEVVHELLGSR
jgi:glycerate kinase